MTTTITSNCQHEFYVNTMSIYVFIIVENTHNSHCCVKYNTIYPQPSCHGENSNNTLFVWFVIIIKKKLY